ncbi:hypothetical protein H4281_02870 [Amycolatopsis sp. DR6-1]|uniref:Uncharacterized protein n=1 Tax=Amycolatopsis dendrobii TaxID=2760662 RepID=A0A7W3VS19_9PSEU|nr:hypothetical protein [Amycolatopsis dendrobii]
MFDCPWPRLPVARRIEVCQRFCDLIEERSDEIGLVWAAEAGIPVRWIRTLHRFAAKAAWRTARASRRSAPAAGDGAALWRCLAGGTSADQAPLRGLLPGRGSPAAGRGSREL